MLALVGSPTGSDTICPLIVGRRCAHDSCSLKVRVSDCFKPVLVADNEQGHPPLQARDLDKMCLDGGAFFDGNGPVLTACESIKEVTCKDIHHDSVWQQTKVSGVDLSITFTCWQRLDAGPAARRSGFDEIKELIRVWRHLNDGRPCNNSHRVSISMTPYRFEDS